MTLDCKVDRTNWTRQYEIKSKFGVLRMGESGQRYNLEFKKETVKYIQERSKSIPEIAEELNIPAGTLTKWMAKYREFPNRPFVGSGNLRTSDQELKRQASRIRDLEEENEILKKAVRIVSPDRK